MNAKNLIETLSEYLVSDDAGKRIYHLPETLALRINLSALRSEYPQTTLVINGGYAMAKLTIE